MMLNDPRNTDSRWKEGAAKIRRLAQPGASTFVVVRAAVIS